MTRREVVLPALGEGVETGEVVAWLVDPGDAVRADDPVAEVETDKSMIEVPTPADGTLLERLVEVGSEVEVGAPIAIIEAEDAPEEDTAVTDSAVSSTADGDEGDDERTAPSQGDQPTVAAGRVFAPPRLRRRARETGVDLSTLSGSGPNGRLTADDIRDAIDERTSRPSDDADESDADGGPSPRTVPEGKPAVKPADEDGDTEGEDDESAVDAPRPTPRSVEAGTPAVSAVESSSASDATPAPPPEPTPDSALASTPPSAANADTATPRRTVHHDEADVTSLLSLRERLGDDLAAGGTDLSALPFAVAAVAAAAERVPAINGAAAADPDDGPEAVNVAVGVPTAEGVRYPVVVDADDVGIRGLAEEVDDLVARARADDLAPAETADATVAVTDFGALGGTYAVPDLAATGTATLALGAIRTLPRVPDDEVVPRDVLTLSTAVDARRTDAGVATRFTAEVRRYLTEPELLLL
jgi:pyruvate dehydrogenase E2 component (dihydrolipoamide acetyltransferase)